MLPKRNLIRVVRTSDGIQVDLTGKAAGRGAYIHDTTLCWQKSLKGALASALRTEITPADSARLEQFAASLSDKTGDQEQVPGGSK